MKKVSITFIVVMIFYGAFFLYVINHKEHCDQPCKDLGSVAYLGEHIHKGVVLEAACDPLTLKLELAERPVKVGERYSLWHRIEIKNNCCGITSLRLPFLLANAQGTKLSFDVWGPGGEKISSTPTSVLEDFYLPYKYEKHENAELAASKFIHWIYPGETLSSTPMRYEPHKKLSPYLEDRFDEFWSEFPDKKFDKLKERDRRFQEKRVNEMMKKLKPPKPIPGYRVLDRFVFKKPGIYKIQVHLEDIISLYSGRSWFRDLFPPFDILAQTILSTRGISSNWNKEVHIDIRSPMVEFEVVP
ncbi:MAG: hypothetical protein COB53_11490 [Elusimicrobia bacterium]|nr:MAG: hypothetical protein COB53_11490 [Elusimicrobiota bacterium]